MVPLSLLVVVPLLEQDYVYQIVFCGIFINENCGWLPPWRYKIGIKTFTFVLVAKNNVAMDMDLKLFKTVFVLDAP